MWVIRFMQWGRVSVWVIRFIHGAKSQCGLSGSCMKPSLSVGYQVHAGSRVSVWVIRFIHGVESVWVVRFMQWGRDSVWVIRYMHEAESQCGLSGSCNGAESQVWIIRFMQWGRISSVDYQVHA